MTEQKDTKTKEELQEELKEQGKPTEGTKAELEERLQQASRDHKPDVFVAQVRPQ